MDVYQLIADVPEYHEFLTVQELSASSRDLGHRSSPDQRSTLDE